MGMRPRSSLNRLRQCAKFGIETTECSAMRPISVSTARGLWTVCSVRDSTTKS